MFPPPLCDVGCVRSENLDGLAGVHDIDALAMDPSEYSGEEETEARLWAREDAGHLREVLSGNDQWKDEPHPCRPDLFGSFAGRSRNDADSHSAASVRESHRS